MDFILEHNDDPIPDATSGTTATSSAQPQSGPMDEDDDEETAALRAVYGVSPGAAAQDGNYDAGVEARVSGWDHFQKLLFIRWPFTEHQMLRVREDIQEHRTR